MTTATMEIDQLLDNRSEDEIKFIARRAIKLLLDRHADVKQPLPLLGEGEQDSYLVYPCRHVKTLKTEDEFVAELQRRIELEPNNLISAEEFLVSLKD